MISTALPTQDMRRSRIAARPRPARARVGAETHGPVPGPTTASGRAVVSPAATSPAAASGAAASAAPRRVRRRALSPTRRGKALLLVLLVALLLGAFAAGRTASRAAEPAARSSAGPTAVAGSSTSQTTVAPGETLWGVARRIAPDRDPREIVAQLRRLNDLPTAGLQAGQQLVLPGVR